MKMNPVKNADIFPLIFGSDHVLCLRIQVSSRVSELIWVTLTYVTT